MIKAMKELKSDNVHLIISGGGTLRNKLEKLTSTLKLENKLNITNKY